MVPGLDELRIPSGLICSDFAGDESYGVLES